MNTFRIIIISLCIIIFGAFHYKKSGTENALEISFKDKTTNVFLKDYEFTTSYFPYDEKEGTRFNGRPVYHPNKNGIIQITTEKLFERYTKENASIDTIYGIFRTDHYRETFFKIAITDQRLIIEVDSSGSMGKGLDVLFTDE